MSIADQSTYISPEQYMAVINDVENAKSIQALIDLAITFTDIKMINYHHISGYGSYDHKNIEHHVCYNFPEIVQNYLEGADFSKDDLGLIVTFSSPSPIWLSEMLEHEYVKGHVHGEKVKKLMELTGDGLFLALYGPQGRKGYVFVVFSHPKEFYCPVFKWQVHSMLTSLHVRYCFMLAELRKKIKLTNRESQVLELIALGKTNPEIGTILNISKNTVASYMKGIFLKLETSDRVTAAMRARAMNLLV